MSALLRLAGVARRARSVLGSQPRPLAQHIAPVRNLHAGRFLRANIAPPPTPVAVTKVLDNFLDGASAAYLEDLEKKFKEDPSSVDKSWANYLSLLDSGATPASVAEAFNEFKSGDALVKPAQSLGVSQEAIMKSMRMILLIRAYQVSGHHMANLDPLGMDQREIPVDLDPSLYGFTEEDLDKEFFLGTWRMKGFLSEDHPTLTLRQVLDRLRTTYCGSVGYEYMHIGDREKCNWLRERIEVAEPPIFTKEKKATILDRLAWSDMFENFLSNKYTAAKRFGLEGAESLIPGMKAMIDRSAEIGVDTIVMGMPHRGRLNVLANVVRKPLPQIFSEFSGGVAPEKDGLYSGSGDVKYHLGTSYDRPTLSGKKIHLSLVANPSHLEAVNTVVQGKVRAKQYYEGDDDVRGRHMAILLHGDGAFAGQGIVYETLDMSGLPEYTVGGTIHIVVNNQVAFTTDPKFSRSSPYCTDVAHTVDAPIFHVNGDDVEAVTRVMELAAEWRQRFKSDVVVDIVCYRRFGHNEIDEPMFTQPLMYRKIRNHKSTHQLYADQLVKSGDFSPEEIKGIQDRVKGILEDEFAKSKDYTPQPRDWLASHWDGFKSPLMMSAIRDTGVKLDLINDIANKAFTLPEGFSGHKAVKRVYDARLKSVQDGEGIDWATAEALAFGTLLHEGYHVRLSGQDVERGTFSHRHCILHDQKTGARLCPLDHIIEGQNPKLFTVSNSSLSEFGVLGFELGYSMENPNALVMWEAQFGDFANSAQIIIDQFISSGEAKWLRQSGLVVMLPHGYDGQGPEHSSARLERYLQMVDEDPMKIPDMDRTSRKQIQEINMQVVNISTPANYFHALRRQVHRDFRKPLIVMSPKNLLRHPQAKSPLSFFDDVEDSGESQGPRFRRLIMDDSSTSRDIENPPVEPSYKRVVFCSGKVYYDLAAEREKLGKEKEVAICRVEQIAPFPFDLVKRELKRYPDAEVVWAQEEHMNMGAYAHVLPRFLTVLKNMGRPYNLDSVRYAGRGPSASTATGFGNVHAIEQATLVQEAIN